MGETVNPGTDYAFDLFIAGMGRRSQSAIRALRHVLDENLRGDYALRIVDVLDDPAEAERCHILATPTLIRRSPLPQHRVVGDLDDIDAHTLLGARLYQGDFSS